MSKKIKFDNRYFTEESVSISLEVQKDFPLFSVQDILHPPDILDDLPLFSENLCYLDGLNSNDQIKSEKLNVNPNSLRPKNISDPDTNKKSARTISNSDIADLFLENFRFKLYQDVLYIWDQSKSYYIRFEYIADKFIRQNVPAGIKGKISKNSIIEIIQWIKSSPNIEIDEDSINRKLSYVCFNNYIFDFQNNISIQHDPNIFFTSKIHADYKMNPTYGEIFEKFLKDITKGDMKIYYRIQELFGYVISEIRNIKCLPILYGPKDTGKSIILKLLEKLIGEKHVSNYSFEQLTKDDFLSNLFGKRMNTCGEVSDITLTRLDSLKKLTGNDRFSTRQLYGQPFEMVNEAAIIFAGNQLPTIKKYHETKAFIERLVIIPFLNPISKEKQDTDLINKLLLELDYIAQWSIIGLKRLVKNNHIFTKIDIEESIIETYYPSKNSFVKFIEQNCIQHPDERIYKGNLEKYYDKYCIQNQIKPVLKKDREVYLLELGIVSSKFRLNNDSTPRHGYKGIALRKEVIDAN